MNLITESLNLRTHLRRYDRLCHCSLNSICMALIRLWKIFPHLMMYSESLFANDRLWKWYSNEFIEAWIQTKDIFTDITMYFTTLNWECCSSLNINYLLGRLSYSRRNDASDEFRRIWSGKVVHTWIEPYVTGLKPNKSKLQLNRNGSKMNAISLPKI